MKSELPPFVKEIRDGAVSWRALEDIDHKTNGYFLSCHLVLEHYMDEFMRAHWVDIDWGAAKLTFSQKTTLLGDWKISDKYDCLPALKHLNRLRNKISHDIQYRLTEQDLLPLTQCLNKAYEPISYEDKNISETLHDFTMFVSVLFAGALSGLAKRNSISR